LTAQLPISPGDVLPVVFSRPIGKSQNDEPYYAKQDCDAGPNGHSQSRWPLTEPQNDAAFSNDANKQILQAGEQFSDVI